MIRNLGQVQKPFRQIIGLPVGVALVFVAALVAPSGAVAGQVPGLSEIDQYTETLDGAGGNYTIGSVGTSGEDDGGNSAGGAAGDGNRGGASPVLSPATEREAKRLGAAGREAAALAEATAPDVPPRRGEHLDAKDSGSSGMTSVLDALTGSGEGGIGILLPLILVAIAAGGILFGISRRRERHAGY
jgi:hypothetical protein